MLRELAADAGDNQADIIRRNLRRMHAARFGLPSPAEEHAT